MIQVVTLNGRNSKYKDEKIIEQHSFHDICDIDYYEKTVLDLSEADLWVNLGRNISINEIKNFKSISKMIKNSKENKVLILLPQNCQFHYNYSFISKRYESIIDLKDMSADLSKSILTQLFDGLERNTLAYHNVTTTVEGKDYKASFIFDDIDGASVIVKSNDSKKPVLISAGGVFITTLCVNDSEELFHLMNNVGMIESKVEIPEWMEDINFFDDEELKRNIDNCNDEIATLEEKKKKTCDKLQANKNFESVLYTGGKTLEETVSEILEEMLGYNASDFVDEKNEDFLIELSDHVFIGEIKGVSSNVKNQFISQLDTHRDVYLDNNPDVDGKEVKGLLIINHQKDTKPSEREEVNEKQIKKAVRNRSLIIETSTLLKLLEDYRNKTITRNQIDDMFKNEIGLLEY